MNMDASSYKKFAKAHAPRSPLLKDCLRAFLVGGLICAFAEALFHGYLALQISEENVKTLVPVTLIFLAALLSGLGIFDRFPKGNDSVRTVDCIRQRRNDC